jgi:hypothetical protein
MCTKQIAEVETKKESKWRHLILGLFFVAT